MLIEFSIYAPGSSASGFIFCPDVVSANVSPSKIRHYVNSYKLGLHNTGKKTGIAIFVCSAIYITIYNKMMMT